MTRLCPSRLSRLLVALAFLVPAIVARPAGHAQQKNAPLAPADVDDIVLLEKLEDTRQLDSEALARILRSAVPELRRRAVVSIGRIAKPEGKALLAPLRDDRDVDVVADVAFSTGQLKDAESIGWLSQVLSASKTPEPIAFEAARALGKIRTPESRAALAAYLAAAPATDAAAPVVGEALLSIGRFAPGELAPIVRWATFSDVEVRWRAAWALFRPKDPAAIPDLLRLSRDPSPEVRFWAVRGLAADVVDKSTTTRAVTSARLREAVQDGDRRVRTEALRALTAYDDDESFAVVLAAIDSPDTWLSMSSAESLGRFKDREEAVLPKLVAATSAAYPLALRITALKSLGTLAPEATVGPAAALIREDSGVARSTAAQALRGAGEPGRAKLDQLAADPTTKDLVPAAPVRGGGGGRGASAPPAPKADEEYRRIVTDWLVPDRETGAKPHVLLETPRGQIDIELNAADAPLAVDAFVKLVDSGAIVGTEFGRVVPNFVAQQATIRGAPLLRDEVNRRGLTRGNVSWASGGLDTGRPGFTFGNTPQPHNEGDFTALGRVVSGMDVVDHLELGDKITGARVVSR